MCAPAAALEVVLCLYLELLQDCPSTWISSEGQFVDICFFLGTGEVPQIKTVQLWILELKDSVVRS